MGKDNEQNERRQTRMQGFDYSTAGAYFVTVCTENRKQILSRVVGVGALDDPPIAQICLTDIGKIVEKHLLSSERISGVTIDAYVIMPDHIHVIIFLDPKKCVCCETGSSRAPTPTNEMLPHIVSTFKRFCNKEIGANIFQRSYYDHIIRSRDDYDDHVRYICGNPHRWYCKHTEPET